MDGRRLGALCLAAWAAAPALTLGFFRDDWLLLWDAIDPDAPSGAGGVFARPLARAFWAAAIGIGGDAPLSMHLPAWILVLVVSGLAGAVAHRLGARSAWIAAAWLGTHAALLELRLWAAASNALLALALGLLGWWLVLGDRESRGRAALAVLLIGAGALARADAVLLLWPLPFWWPLSPRTRGMLLAAAAGVGLLAAGITMNQVDRVDFDPNALGAAARGVVFPWGGAREGAAQAAFAVAGAIAMMIILKKQLGSRERAGVATMLAVAWLSQGLASWAPAGRYLMVPVLATGVLLAFLPGGRLRDLAVAGVVVLHGATGWWGSTAADLRARATAESALYEFARREPVQSPVTLIDPPPLGWHDSPEDAENVLSAATRRMIEVEFATQGPGLRYRDGNWSR